MKPVVVLAVAVAFAYLVDFSPAMNLVRAYSTELAIALGGAAALAGTVFIFFSQKGKSRGAVPNTMRACMLVKHTESSMSSDVNELSSCFEVREIETPTPPRDHVLVKVMASPINPSDLSTFKGSYNSAQRADLPCTVGFEGAGVVVQSGGGFFSGLRMGKRVALVTKGSGSLWAEYAVVPALQTIPLPDDVSFEEGCSCFVNPWTAISFIELAQQGKHKCILLTAAASSLCKMVHRLAQQNGIRVIAIVRRRSHEETLRGLGACEVIVTAEEDWKEKLRDACKEHNCRIGFDAVAGPKAGTVLSCMPSRSNLYVYGGLSNQAISQVRPTDLIFKSSNLRGFWLTAYLKTKGIFGLLNFSSTTQAYISSFLKTDIRGTYSLEQAPQAIADYCSNMSAGKVAICPNKE